MNRKKMKIIGLLVGIATLLCILLVLNLLRVFHVPDSALPGKYVGKHGKGEDTIELRADGTYEHLYREKPYSELRVNTGTWKRDDNGGITFSKFQDFTNLVGGQLGRELMEPHFASWGVFKPFLGNAVRIGGSEVIPNYYYEKED